MPLALGLQLTHENKSMSMHSRLDGIRTAGVRIKFFYLQWTPNTKDTKALEEWMGGNIRAALQTVDLSLQGLSSPEWEIRLDWRDKDQER